MELGILQNTGKKVNTASNTMAPSWWCGFPKTLPHLFTILLHAVVVESPSGISSDPCGVSSMTLLELLLLLSPCELHHPWQQFLTDVSMAKDVASATDVVDNCYSGKNCLHQINLHCQIVWLSIVKSPLQRHPTGDGRWWERMIIREDEKKKSSSRKKNTPLPTHSMQPWIIEIIRTATQLRLPRCTKLSLWVRADHRSR